MKLLGLLLISMLLCSCLLKEDEEKYVTNEQLNDIIIVITAQQGMISSLINEIEALKLQRVCK